MTLGKWNTFYKTPYSRVVFVYCGPLFTFTWQKFKTSDDLTGS